MCQRTFCQDCDLELIHRDNRKRYESASGLGQIVHRDGPRTFTVGDVDLYLRKWLGGATLLRLIEHKQPAQAIKEQQAITLSMLDSLFEHAIGCTDAPVRLDPRSGVYIMRGEIFAEPSGRRKTSLGPQRVWNPRHQGWSELPSQIDVFRWMDGKFEPPILGVGAA